MMALVRNVGANAIVSFADQLTVSGTNFITGIVVARLLGPGQYGLFNVCLTLILTASVLQGSLVLIPYALHRNRLSDQERRMAIGDVLRQFGYCTLASMLLIGIYMGIFLRGEVHIFEAGWVLIFSALIPCALFRELCRGICIGDMRFAATLYMDVTASIGLFVGFYLAYVSERLTLSAVFLSLCIAALAASLIWRNSYRHEVSFCREFARENFLRHWHLGRWILAGNAPLMINFGVNLWLVAALLGTNAAGIYGACNALIMAINPAMTASHNVILTHASRSYVTQDRGKLFRLALHSAGLIAVVTGIFFTLLFSLSDWLLGRVFGPEFAGNGTTLGILAMGMWLRFVSMPMQVVLLVIERAEVNATINLLALIINTLTTLVLLPQIGILGAAMSVVISEGVAAGVRLIGLAGFMKSSRQTGWPNESGLDPVRAISE